MKKNERVAVVSADQKTFLGYGVYEGDFDCAIMRKTLAVSAREIGEMEMAEQLESGEFPYMNPRILLDSGERVWGCECWWGPRKAFEDNGYAKKYGLPADPGAAEELLNFGIQPTSSSA